MKTPMTSSSKKFGGSDRIRMLATGQFSETRKGRAEAVVQAAKKSRAERVGAALKQASSSTGILRKG